jgi:hypothetical protein
MPRLLHRTTKVPGGDSKHRGDLIFGHTLTQQRWNAGEHVVRYS